MALDCEQFRLALRDMYRMLLDAMSEEQRRDILENGVRYGILPEQAYQQFFVKLGHLALVKRETLRPKPGASKRAKMTLEPELCRLTPSEINEELVKFLDWWMERVKNPRVGHRIMFNDIPNY